MRRIGRAVGMALAFAFSAAAAVAAMAWGGGMEQALWNGIGLFAAGAPVGWILGSKVDRLKEWAEKDPLTGAFNRRFLERVYPRLVAQADRRRKRFSVILVDVNDFKGINDTMGHAKGDEILRKLAGGLFGASRQGEIPVRWGGDEFLLLCPYGDRSSMDGMCRAVDESAARIHSQGSRSLSVSIGTAVYPDDGRVLEELVQKADLRMYADKQRGKDTAVQRLNA